MSLPDYEYRVGQVVRIRKGISNDGQTPERWDGALATVESMYRAGFVTECWYRVRHSDGFHHCVFRAAELDLRYRKGMR